jgi:hypothetical protein
MLPFMLKHNLYINYHFFGGQGIEFWLSHALPVDHLENLLLKHMSKFFYPLGLLLFCKDGNTGEEEVETQQQAVSMLNHLSTRFCLQLCSSLLNHINQSKTREQYSFINKSMCLDRNDKISPVQ